MEKLKKKYHKKKIFFSLSKNLLKDWIFEYYKHSNVKIAWVRIFYIYGTGQRSTSLIPSLIDAKIKKKKIKIKTPNDFCDFIHVDDVVSFFKTLINKEFKSSTFNLGSGKPTKVINICKKILQQDFKKLCIYNNKSKIKNYYWANMSNTKKETGFKIKISLDNGLKKYSEFMKINQAVIFCGGKGLRLKSYTKTTPKPMVLVHHKPFLYYLLMQLKKKAFIIS